MLSKSRLKFGLGFFVPYSVVLLRSAMRQRKMLALRDHWRAEAAKLSQHLNQSAKPFDYEAAVKFLGALGCDESQVREGSIPATSLEYCACFISHLYDGAPLLGLHIGNFVGVSLCYLSDLVRKLHPESRLVSIDPDIPHRGITNPLEKVLRLLNYFGLHTNNLILTGYSLGRNVRNDGTGFDPGHYSVADFEQEISCEQQLPSLAALLSGRFDFALIDGNHDADYLAQEMGSIHTLLKPGGLLILDDVSHHWPGILEAFHSVDPREFTRAGDDGRVGVLRKV